MTRLFLWVIQARQTDGRRAMRSNPAIKAVCNNDWTKCAYYSMKPSRLNCLNILYWQRCSKRTFSRLSFWSVAVRTCCVCVVGHATHVANGERRCVYVNGNKDGLYDNDNKVCVNRCGRLSVRRAHRLDTHLIFIAAVSFVVTIY